MPNSYKLQLLLNLAEHYNEPLWRSVTNFKGGKDELLFIIPAHQDAKQLSGDLFRVLAALPDIAHKPERCVISFCYGDGSGYHSTLINPSTQDKINLALIGYRPQRKVTQEELKSLGIYA